MIRLGELMYWSGLTKGGSILSILLNDVGIGGMRKSFLQKKIKLFFLKNFLT